MPGQLIFGRDMILNMQYLADWTAIKARKQQLICKNNIIENKKRIPHQYKVGDKVMLENHRANKYEQPYKGPYLVTQINTNGTVRSKMVQLRIPLILDVSIHLKWHRPTLIMGASTVCAIA